MVEAIPEWAAQQRVLTAEEAKMYVPKVCGSCGKKLNRWNGWRIRDEQNAVRCQCGAEVDLYSMDLGVLRSNEKWLTHENIGGSFWHHATHKEDWFKGVTKSIFAPEFVHVGTHYSAKSRACTEGCTKMYKVRVNDDARVSPQIYIDHNEWTPVEILNTEYDVVRYINRWESVGSISLMVRPRVLTLA